MRDGLTTTPNPGPVQNRQELNDNRLVPGVTIRNNILAQNETGGIRFSGDLPALATDQPAPIPFGRIINNTIVGGAIATAPDADPAIFAGVSFDVTIGKEKFSALSEICPSGFASR